MTFREKVVEILTQRATEIFDAGTNLDVVDSADFDQIAIDLEDLLINQYSFDPAQAETEKKSEEK